MTTQRFACQVDILSVPNEVSYGPTRIRLVEHVDGTWGFVPSCPEHPSWVPGEYDSRDSSSDPFEPGEAHGQMWEHTLNVCWDHLVDDHDRSDTGPIDDIPEPVCPI